MKIVRYVKHKVPVYVRTDLKGREDEFSLCGLCKRFAPKEGLPCPIALEVMQTCVIYDLATPIFECPVYDGPVGDA